MLEIVSAIAREFVETFFVNYLFVFLYVIIIVFIRMQYEKYSDLQSGISGIHGSSLKEITEGIILVSLVTGFAGSFAVIGAGITITPDAVNYLFFIMFALLLINIRFVSFAYAAGILALISLIFNYPQTDIPSVLALAAMMHLIESLLIFLNKGKDSIPVFIKHKGEIAGAYLIRKFWPIPIIFLTLVQQGALQTAAGFPINRWMLFTPKTLGAAALAFSLDSVVAVLCYSDLAITKHPEKKSKETSYMILCYSLLLFTIALVSIRVPWLKAVGAVFCIAGREAVTLYGRHTEKTGTPLFAPVRRGLKVMEAIPGSHAERMGIQKGDVILNVNGKDVQTEEGLNEALRDYPVFTWIQVVGWDGIEKTYEYKCFPGGYNTLGIIPVPREREVTYNTDNFENLSILKNIVARFKGMNRA